ncbi:MAG: KOW domain-containing RNA-binding protein [Eubacteriales bacterium]
MESTGELCLGQIVSSKAGRDKDKVFAVVEIIDDKYVFIADGDLRKIENPKKKKVKHLQKYNTINEELKRKLETGSKIENIELQKDLEKSGIIWLKI